MNAKLKIKVGNAATVRIQLSIYLFTWSKIQKENGSIQD